MDAAVALLPGLATCPIVFAQGLAPGTGSGLNFITLPVAFRDLPSGTILVILFILFVAVAALSSTNSHLEPVVVLLQHSAIVLGAAFWILGFGPALVFNHWSEFRIAGKNLFDFL